LRAGAPQALSLSDDTTASPFEDTRNAWRSNCILLIADRMANGEKFDVAV